jgi:hypothetical protein
MACPSRAWRKTGRKIIISIDLRRVDIGKPFLHIANATNGRNKITIGGEQLRAHDRHTI